MASTERNKRASYKLLIPVVALVALLLLAGEARPAYAATFTVTNTSDAAAGSLRQAILDANANLGIDTIAFNIPAATDPGCNAGTGVCTFQPGSVLPTITDPVIIDGYTQAGASPNTNGPGLGSNAVLMIELDGTNAGAGADGLTITAGSSTVRGLVINRFGGAGTQFGSAGIQIGAAMWRWATMSSVATWLKATSSVSTLRAPPP